MSMQSSFSTVDTITSLLAPLIHPIPSLVPLLVHLSLRPSYFSSGGFWDLIHGLVHTLLHPRPFSSLSVLVLYSFTTFLFWILCLLNEWLSTSARRPIDWQDELVLITGGEGGLGHALADIFALRGVDVAVADVLPATDRRTKEWAEAGNGGGISYYQCDVGDPESVSTLKSQINREFGQSPTILINAAAFVPFRSILDVSTADLKRSVGVNLLGHFHIIRTFLPSMLTRPNGGTVVTVASVLGYLGCAGLADYTVAKSGLITLHHSLNAELAMLSDESSKDSYPQHIRTILVTPGQLSTRLFERIKTPSQFLGPTVPPAALAQEIVKAVDGGTDAHISRPLYAKCVSLGIWGVLPKWLKGRRVRGLVGLDFAGWQAMEEERKDGEKQA